MGFWEDLNRVNVALSRAPRKLIVAGNGALLGKRVGLLGRFMEEAMQSQCFYAYVDGVIERKLPPSSVVLESTGSSDSRRF